MAQRYDFTIDQGTSVGKTISVFLDGSIFDLTNYNARLFAREKVYEDPVLELYSDELLGSGLSIPTPANGQVLLSLTSEETAALDFSQAGYNLEIYTVDGEGADVIVYRVLEGFITLSKEYAK